MFVERRQLVLKPKQKASPGVITPGEDITTVVAGQTLGGHRAIYVIGNQAFYADYQSPFAVLTLGIITHAATEGEEVAVLTDGEITEPSWNWTPESVIYLGNNGMLTQVPPTTGALVELGIAVSAQRLFVRIQETIFLAE